jgi:hypothetical protein
VQWWERCWTALVSTFWFRQHFDSDHSGHEDTEADLDDASSEDNDNTEDGNTSDYDSSEVDSDYSEHTDAEADLDDASMEDNDERMATRIVLLEWEMGLQLLWPRRQRHDLVKLYNTY